MRVTTREWVALAVIALAPCAAEGGGDEDCVIEGFEESTVGEFPCSPWLDVGLIDPSPPNPPDPSVVVGASVDANGAPTNVLDFIDAIAPSQGVYVFIPPADALVAEASVRIDRYNDASASAVSDWPFALAFAEFVPELDVAGVTQVAVYVSTFTGTWQLFANYAEAGPVIDFGVPAVLGTWYSARMDLDTETGLLHTLVRDLSADVVVVDDLRILDDWTSSALLPDIVTIYDGELSEGVTIANLAVVDDVCIGPLPPSGDVDGDGIVNVEDLVLVISAWGPCGDCCQCPADLDGDCAVAVGDLIEVLLGWT